MIARSQAGHRSTSSTVERVRIVSVSPLLIELPGVDGAIPAIAADGVTLGVGEALAWSGGRADWIVTHTLGGP